MNAMNEADQVRLLTKTQAALKALRAMEGAGLTEESEDSAASRAMAVKALDGGAFQLWVASDGLSLDAKLKLERGLKDQLGEDFAVYFKRREGATGAGPAPRTSEKAPFGLNLSRRAIPGVREIIVVASGKGGVGKSTVSTNLAVALAASGARVGLLDADIYGPSAPLMMGLKGPLPVSGEKIVPLAAHGVKTVSFGFLTDTTEPVIWRGPLVAKALKQLCFDVLWGELDYLVIDLPPGTGDVQMTLIESVPIRGAIIVTTPQDVALLDAHKALTMFEKLGVPVLGLVENMAHFHCANCGHEEAIFGEGGGARMAAERKLNVVARVPLGRALRECGDAGRPAALASAGAFATPFHELAKVVLAAP